MLELGEHAREEHERMGRLAIESKVDVVIAVGAGARHIADGARSAGGGAAEVLEVDDADSALAALSERTGRGDAVLVKASRAVGLERVAEALTPGAGA
jgi:UDP-N-acetylmuramoyl-tripeptide--D-alanyl-D-alanine ligase